MPTTTTPAATLREAASRMRELAVAATPGPWIVGGDDDDEHLLIEVGEPGKFRPIALMPSDRDDPETWQDDSADAAHIAAWHPAVALAVANWLEMMADHAQGRGAICGSCVEQALNVARVFLGTDR